MFDLYVNVYHGNIILYLCYKLAASCNVSYNNNYNIYNCFGSVH